MSRRRAELVLWALAAACAVLAAARWREAVPGASAPAASPFPPAPAAPRGVPEAALSRAFNSVTRRDPFRLDRAPAPVGFSVQPALAPGAPPPPPPPPALRPPLALAGIVGPPWEALLEGVPGREGAAVVRAGDRLGELRVRSVTRDQVVVQGPDTTWRLSVKRPWQ